jgi:RHS repeat-associated protein
LGSACLELDNTGQIISYEEYHPFGTTSYRSGRNETEVSLKRYKYNGQERDEETGLYYYGARYYAAWLGRFVSCDPLAVKFQNTEEDEDDSENDLDFTKTYSMWYEYSHWSPFAYCSNNPINRIDPTGMTDFEINSTGKVVNRIENTERDAFFMVDKKGNRIEGKELTFDYGTVENFQSQYSDEAKTTFDWYNVRGDDNGKQLFEFFANNTTVEFSQLQLGQKGDNGLNIISTSHEKSTERCVNFLLDNKYKFGYTIRGHNHNHPGNTPYPSGLKTRDSDIGFSNYLTNASLKNGSGVPVFKIYLSKTGKYVNYNRNSTIYDFPATRPKPIELPELIVSPRR